MDVQTKDVGAKKQHGKWAAFLRLTFKGLAHPLVLLGVVLVIGLGLLANEITVRIPQYTGMIFALQQGAEGFDFGYVAKWLAIFLVAQFLLDAVIAFVKNVASGQMDQVLQLHLWKHLSRLPLIKVDSIGANELVSRTAQDTTLISEGVIFALVGLIPTVQLTYRIFGEVYQISSLIFWLMMVLIPLNIIVGFLYGRWSFSANRSVQARLAGVTRYLSELFFNLPFIKSSNTEKYEQKRGHKGIDQLYRADLSKGFLDWFQLPIQSIMDLLSTIVIIGVGLVMISRGKLELEGWMMLIMYSALVTGALYNYLDYFVRLKAAQGASARIGELQALQPEDLTKGVEAEAGDIVFEDVHFSYVPDEEVLKGLNFTLRQGEKLVILGESGCGKSTLMNCLLRLYQLDKGQITLGGRPVEETSLKSYRDLFSLVLQDSPVLSDTVRENILYGMNREVSEEELRQACRRAQALEFIEEMENGLDSHVGVNGSKLSGGQRQRLALARCFLKEAPILVYDEPTASLDNITEMLVDNAINDAPAGTTRIIITHDLSDILTADKILILDKGEQVAFGTPDEVRQCDLFRRFVADHLSGGEALIYG